MNTTAAAHHPSNRCTITTAVCFLCSFSPPFIAMPRLNSQESGSLTPAPSEVGGSTMDEPTPETWVPPTWLLGETSSKRPHGRVFKLKIPAVPAAVRDAIQQGQAIVTDKDEQKARLLRLKLHEQRHKRAKAQRAAQALQATRERKLEELRNQRTAQVQQTLQQLEDSLRGAFEQEQEEKDQAWRQAISDQCAAERQRSLQELQAKEALEDEERAKAKKARLAKANEKTPEQANAEAAVRAALDELETKKAELQHKRGELIWLVKKTIKAEEKQKAGLQNPASRSLASKQA